MDVADDAQGPLDPRIQIELENLNTATDDINKLEMELDEANTTFKYWQSQSFKKLIDIRNRIGAGHVDKARCYYDAVKVARQAQLQSQHQVQLYERASEIHTIAKETVALAESKFISHKHEWNFDQAWQDMLNHATIMVRDAEDKKSICGREHQLKMKLFEDANKKAHQLEEKYRRSILKARIFFEQQEIYEQDVVIRRAKISCLEKAIKDAKRAYSKSFRTLEEISNEIHQQRRDYVMMVNGPREPGVGAELISPEESLNYEKELNCVTVDRMNSIASGSSDTDAEDRARDIADVLELKDRMENIGGRSVDGSESTSNQWELELQASLEKLNTLTNKNVNWNDPSPVLKLNEDNLSDCGNNITNSSLKLDHRMQSDYNQSSKLPMGLQLLQKISSQNDERIDNNHGCHSLTQSPINSILNKSKLTIKNSLSKSLNNSPINIGFKSSESNISNNLSPVNSHNVRVSTNNSIITNISPSKNNQRDSKNLNDNNELTVPMREHNKSLVNTVNEVGKSCDNINDGNGNRLKNETLDDHSLNNGANIQFVDKPKFHEASYKMSSIKELPLLSMFEGSEKLPISKDKSCSMINLTEKQNLKTLLDRSPVIGNIQAISVERLANARHNLMAKLTNAKPQDSLSKK